jgi:epoxide hydrolase-like predicted phosphatase
VKRALIFDFGGVLMKTVDYTPRFRWDDRLQLARGHVERIVHGSESWRLAQTGLLAVENYWHDVAHQLQLTPEQLTQLQHDFFSGDQLDETLIAYIRQLRQAGHTVALLSNDSPALMEKLQTFNIVDLFDPLIISANIGVMKPAPESYQKVLDYLRCHPQDTIFIDDNADNIIGAKALGIHTVHYTPGLDLPRILDPLLNMD